MPRVTLYTRQGCHLCEAARAVLQEAAAQARFELEVVDIDLDDALYGKYNEQVPVTAIDGVEAFGPEIRLEPLLKRLRRGT